MTNPHDHHAPHYAVTPTHPSRDPSPPPQTHSPDEAASLPLARLVTGVLRHRKTAFACALLGAVAGAAFPLIQTRTYTAEGSFLLKHGGEEIDVRGLDGDVDRNVGYDVPHLLLSADLLRRVVQRVEGKSPTEGAGTTAEAIAYLRDRIEILVPRQSRLVHVYLEGDSPDDAQRTLDAFMQEAIAHHLDVYSDTRSIELIRQNHVQAVGTLEAARTRAAEFVTETGIVEFEAELETRRNDLAAAMRERQELGRNARLENLREPRIDGMREQLRELENRAIELRARLRPDDQAIVNTERAIDELQDRMQAVAVDHAAFLREDVTRRVDEAKQSLAELTPFEPRFRSIQQDVAKAEQRLTAAEIALERANHKQLMAKNLLSALTILDHPTRPEFADAASATTLLVRGLLLGLLAGLGIALMRTLTDQRVRSVEDIEGLGAPVLATIPHLSTKQIQRHQQSRMIG